MFSIFLRFLGILYPVLKESLFGKQKLVDAFKTKKIQLITLAYCVISPFVIYGLSTKVVNLAAANVVLTAKVADIPTAIDPEPINAANASIKPEPTETKTKTEQPIIITPKIKDEPVKSHKLVIKQDASPPPLKIILEPDPGNDFDTILNRTYEND